MDGGEEAQPDNTSTASTDVSLAVSYVCVWCVGGRRGKGDKHVCVPAYIRTCMCWVWTCTVSAIDMCMFVHCSLSYKLMYSTRNVLYYSVQCDTYV